MLNNVQTKTAELIYERNRSKMVLAQLPDGIIVTDSTHKLISANRAAETMLGFSTDRAKGQTIIQYIKNEKLNSLFKNQLNTVKDNTVIRELMIPSSSGKEEYFQIALSPLLDTTTNKLALLPLFEISPKNDLKKV